ncbi:hypothetical protein B0H10DRAFT_1973508 [Mycena sp. CBHHK59/15]|nr:hypothetical protein B0H10DRAFT_1973508 [Mycena sp. CBHHK59/15]
MSIKVKQWRIAQRAEDLDSGAVGSRGEPGHAGTTVVVAAEKESREVIAAVKADRERTARVHEALQSLKNAGCKSTYQFFEKFFGSTTATSRSMLRASCMIMGRKDPRLYAPRSFPGFGQNSSLPAQG